MSDVTTAVCPICGGSAGRFPPEGHHLCQARRDRGLLTPSLGNRCRGCDGTGFSQAAKLREGIYLPLNPTAAELAARFPKCLRCGGTGVE